MLGTSFLVQNEGKATYFMIQNFLKRGGKSTAKGRARVASKMHPYLKNVQNGDSFHILVVVTICHVVCHPFCPRFFKFPI